MDSTLRLPELDTLTGFIRRISGECNLEMEGDILVGERERRESEVAGRAFVEWRLPCVLKKIVCLSRGK